MPTKKGIATLFLTTCFLLSGLLPSQSGSITFFGIGCPGNGKGPASCHSLNGNGGKLVIRTLPNEYGFAVKAPAPLVVLGFQLFTKGVKGVAMTGTALYLEDANTPGKPAFTPVATGQMPVGTTEAFYTTLLDKPVPIAKDRMFWIAQADNTTVHPCDLSGGSNPQGTTYWRRANYQNNAWVATSTLKFPAWRIICPGLGSAGERPYLHITGGVPTVGKLFNVNLNYAFGPSSTIFLMGNSNSAWGALPLPLDLAALGASGCSLYVSGTFLFTGATSANGTAMIPIGIPPLKDLAGARFYQQWIVLDPKANTLQVTFSNAGEGLIGL